MLIGYARVSTEDQHLHLQIDALKKAGCEKFFTDEMSGAKSERPGLNEALAFVRAGDTLVVWRLDRLGRSLKDLIAAGRGAEATPGGVSQPDREHRHLQFRRQVHVPRLFGASRVRARPDPRAHDGGLDRGTARGRLGGRPRAMAAEKIKMAASLMKDPNVSVKEICRNLGVSRTTLYRYIGPHGEIRQGHDDPVKPHR